MRQSNDGGGSRKGYQSSGYNATKAIKRDMGREDAQVKSGKYKNKIHGVGRLRWFLASQDPARIERYLNKTEKGSPTQRAEGGIRIYKKYKDRESVKIDNSIHERKRKARAAAKRRAKRR